MIASVNLDVSIVNVTNESVAGRRRKGRERKKRESKRHMHRKGREKEKGARKRALFVVLDSLVLWCGEVDKYD